MGLDLADAGCDCSSQVDGKGWGGARWGVGRRPRRTTAASAAIDPDAWRHGAPFAPKRARVRAELPQRPHSMDSGLSTGGRLPAPATTI